MARFPCWILWFQFQLLIYQTKHCVLSLDLHTPLRITALLTPSKMCSASAPALSIQDLRQFNKAEVAATVRYNNCHIIVYGHLLAEVTLLIKVTSSTAALLCQHLISSSPKNNSGF
jgi:hypothetical protein